MYYNDMKLVFIVIVNFILLIENVINVKSELKAKAEVEEEEEETKVKCIKRNNQVYCSTIDNSYPKYCLLYTSPSPRDRTRSRMPSTA